MKASVVVCAYTQDRWDDIVRGLRALERQTLPAAEIVLVIDHNIPLRAALLERSADFDLPLEIIDNDGPRGLSGARNAGIAAAGGDIVAFLDDDAAPDVSWLATLTAPFDDPDVMVVGGKAVPAWPGGRPPAWFPEEFQWVVGCSYRGLPESDADVRNVIGASMAIRRTAFTSVGLFPDGIGRIGALPVGCEETEFCIRARREIPGARVVYRPESVVHHRVTDIRATPHYFFSRCLAEGRSKAQIAELVGADAATSAERSYASRVLPRGALLGLVAPLRGDLRGPLRSLFIVLGFVTTAVGYLQGRLTSARRRGR